MDTFLPPEGVHSWKPPLYFIHFISWTMKFRTQTQQQRGNNIPWLFTDFVTNTETQFILPCNVNRKWRTQTWKADQLSTYLASSAEKYDVATLKVGFNGLCLCCHTSSGVWNGPYINTKTGTKYMGLSFWRNSGDVLVGISNKKCWHSECLALCESK